MGFVHRRLSVDRGHANDGTKNVWRDLHQERRTDESRAEARARTLSPRQTPDACASRRDTSSASAESGAGTSAGNPAGRWADIRSDGPSAHATRACAPRCSSYASKIAARSLARNGFQRPCLSSVATRSPRAGPIRPRVAGRNPSARYSAKRCALCDSACSSEEDSRCGGAGKATGSAREGAGGALGAGARFLGAMR